MLHALKWRSIGSGCCVLLFVLSIEADSRCMVDTLAYFTRADTMIRNRNVLISAETVSSALGCANRWDSVAMKLTCVSDDHGFVFSPGNPFYLFDTMACQLPVAPFRHENRLWLPFELCIDVFNSLSSDSLFWDPETLALMACVQPLETGANDGPLKKSTAAPPDIGTPPHAARPEKAGPLAGEKSKIQGQPIRTIVIDPGHGGKDPGAIGPGGTYEKDVVLPIALALRDILKEKTSMNVYMTRETDTFIPLRERTEFANKKKADLFLSIHANSIGGSKKRKNTVRGYKIYFLSEAKNEEDKMVAMRENSVIEFEEDVDKGDYLQNILIDLAGNEYQSESQDLSIMIAETFGESVTKVGKLHRGVGQAPFWVLNGAFMPSVLVETAFISNPKEEKVLKNRSFQKEIALAVYNAIMLFKKKYEVEL
ncbi:MAG: hypothetical protein GF350_16760 [Chitinivibrionales bacterium]|nr:hypothetical protein [Chitinivibrionales bacterium]